LAKNKDFSEISFDILFQLFFSTIAQANSFSSVKHLKSKIVVKESEINFTPTNHHDPNFYTESLMTKLLLKHQDQR
jgi:hypothetical protein